MFPENKDHLSALDVLKHHCVHKAVVGACR